MSGYEDEMDVATLQDLLDDGRFDEAEQLLEIAESEGQPWAASLRALCLAELGRPDAALAAAERGVTADPSSPFGHWVVGALRLDRNHLPEAMSSAQEALRLGSGDSAHWALLARIHAQQKNWSDCLEAAEQGLARHPHDEICAALRALALRGTGSGEDWSEEFERLTHQYPASGWARTGRGWGLLATGRADEARGNFEQALSLDPTSSWARHGLIESIKAKNPIYSALLQLFLWFDSLESRTRWAVIIGGLLGFRYLRAWGELNPEWAPLSYPLLAAWGLFVVASWTSAPLSDFILSRTEVGRGLVRGEDLRASHLVMGLLATALGFGVVAAFTQADRAIFGAVSFGFLIIPVAAVFQCLPGWPRKLMSVYTGIATLAALASVVAPMEIAVTALVVALLMAVLGSWLGVFLASRTVRM